MTRTLFYEHNLFSVNRKQVLSYKSVNVAYLGLQTAGFFGSLTYFGKEKRHFIVSEGYEEDHKIVKIGIHG